MKALEQVRRTALGKLSPTRLLQRMLATPDLPDVIRELAPSELHGLIQRIGLEDSGELVAFATTAQLTAIFDVDLWANVRPGEEETFDAHRFGLWLDVLQEAGDTFVAERLAELPEEFLIFAIHSQVLVLDMDTLAQEMAALSEEDEDAHTQLDKALGDGLYEELENYRLTARRCENWDAVLSALLALDRDNHALLERVLNRCAKMSAAYIEEHGGLYEVLSEAESLADDIAADRDERRAREGYVEPRAARSFLLLASKPSEAMASRDAVTKAYFRELSTEALLASEVRREEIAYLANVLVAAGTIGSRRVRPVEAVRAVARVLEHACGLLGALGPGPVLDAHPADALFRLGWASLHERARKQGRPCEPVSLDVLESPNELT